MTRLTEENVRLAREIIGRYPKARSATIPLLHLAQEQDGYVTNEAMSHIGELVGASSAEVLTDDDIEIYFVVVQVRHVAA